MKKRSANDPFDLETASDLIVVVEDSKPSAAVTSLLFRKLGFFVIECQNGEDAITMLNDMTESVQKKIRLIFSDLMMPKKSGVELLEFVRKHDRINEVPFVICSAVPDREAVTKAREWKVTRFVVKPISAEKIRALVVELLPDHKVPRTS